MLDFFFFFFFCLADDSVSGIFFCFRENEKFVEGKSCFIHVAACLLACLG